MNASDMQKLLFDIANCADVDKLPKELRDKVVKMRDDEEERVRKAEADAIERKRQEDEARKKEKDEESRRLLCTGQWGEKVPPKRRFALCYRMGKFSYDGDHWNKEPFYCAIDLVRGYMSPYWHYYGDGSEAGQRDAFYNERIRPVLEAYEEGDDIKLFKVLRSDWDFFKIHEEDLNTKFEVLDYHIEKGTGLSFHVRNDGWKADKVVVYGRSKPMTFAEHQAALKKEFDK